MRRGVVLLAVMLCGCPEEPPQVPRARLAEATEGEPCAVGLKVVRACGPGLACTAMVVAPPVEKQMFSPEGSGCGGIAQLPCGEGLACLMNEDDPLAKDSMGLCRTQSVCMPAGTEAPAPAPAPAN